MMGRIGKALAFMTSLAACTSVPITSFAEESGEARLSAIGALYSKEGLCGTTQVGRFGSVTTITGDSSIYYRLDGEEWHAIPYRFSAPHSLTRLANGHWLVADTGNHRLVELTRLDDARAALIRERFSAGGALARPHYVLQGLDGYIYTIDTESGLRLIRFRDLKGKAEVWKFSVNELGYVRSLAWFDDHLHVISSSRGEVLRIDDFKKHQYTVFHSPRPIEVQSQWRREASELGPFTPHDFFAGALATTGLVLNHVEKAHGWYYGTNDFLVKFSFGGDTRPARLIRWKTWTDFERGAWEDLSDLIPAGSTGTPLHPYFITIDQGLLYIPVNGDDGDTPCEHGTVLQVDLGQLDRNGGRESAVRHITGATSLVALSAGSA
jgi:hypothetical protein